MLRVNRASRFIFCSTMKRLTLGWTGSCRMAAMKSGILSRISPTLTAYRSGSTPSYSRPRFYRTWTSRSCILKRFCWTRSCCISRTARIRSLERCSVALLPLPALWVLERLKSLSLARRRSLSRCPEACALFICDCLTRLLAALAMA